MLNILHSPQWHVLLSPDCSFALFGKIYRIKRVAEAISGVSCEDHGRTLACAPLAMRKSILRKPQEQADRTRDYSPHAAQPAPPPRFASARASYPVFLSFHDTLKLQIGWAWRGLVDAFRWDVVIGLMTRNVYFNFVRSSSTHYLSGLLTIFVVMQRSARMRSSRSC
jgi:hypothetical protein